jgi:hypothetical protein
MSLESTQPRGEELSWERIALAGGIVYMVAQVSALIVFSTMLLPKMPSIDAPVAERAGFYIQYADRLTVINYLLILPVLFFLVFVGGLYSYLRRLATGEAFAAIVLTAGITTAMIWPFGIVITNIGVEIAREGGDAAVVSALDAMAPLSLALSALPKAVLVAATSIALLQSSPTRRWLVWFGFIVAGLTLIGSLTLVVGELFPVLGFSSLLFYIWVGALSAALLRVERALSLSRSLVTST